MLPAVKPYHQPRLGKIGAASRAELSARVALPRAVALLAALGAAQLMEVAELLVNRPARKGQVLLYEGAPPLGAIRIDGRHLVIIDVFQLRWAAGLYDAPWLG